jgi:hypothetical protein
MGILFALSLSTPLFSFAQIGADDPGTACARDYQKTIVPMGTLTFRTYANQLTGDACLQVLRMGKVIFRRTIGNDGNYTLGQAADRRSGAPRISNGTDITGRGHPDMIVSFYTGGAHCCSLYYIFELEPRFKLLATLDGEDGGGYFKSMGGSYYFLTNDWPFAYWKTSFSDSPAPEIILRFADEPRGGGYHLALDKMQRPHPTIEEWNTRLREAHEAFGESNPFSDGIGSYLWGNMLELIYEGHSELAWKLLDESWPADRKGKNSFLSDFCSQLKTSPYWPDLQPSIPNSPQVCTEARPKNTGM